MTRDATTRSTEQEPNARPADTVVYTDGAYDQAKEGGVQKAGFGVVVVRGGDGENDADAKEVFRGWGQVKTDSASQAFLGAVEHTNNTAELTAIAEAMRWLLEGGSKSRAQSPTPRAPRPAPDW